MSFTQQITVRALADKSNVSRARDFTPNKHPRLSLSGSRKSPPTCTVSLASASTSHDVNIIPFPSDPIAFPTSSPSECDSLALLRSDSDGPPPSPSHAAVRRRRSHARLVQPIFKQSSPATGSSSSIVVPKPSGRKRSKKTSKRLPADLQFLSILHRSIASRRVGQNVQQELTSLHEATQDMETQDQLLAQRIHTLLAKKGYAASLDTTEDDVDVEMADPFINPDRSTPSSPSDTVRAGRARILSMPQLVAALVMQHRERSALRARSRRANARDSTRAGSPLGRSVLVLDAF